MYWTEYVMKKKNVCLKQDNKRKKHEKVNTVFTEKNK